MLTKLPTDRKNTFVRQRIRITYCRRTIYKGIFRLEKSLHDEGGTLCSVQRQQTLSRLLGRSYGIYALIWDIHVAPASFDTQILGLPMESTPTKIREVPAAVTLDVVSNTIQPTPRGSLLYPMKGKNAFRNNPYNQYFLLLARSVTRILNKGTSGRE
jgi:hypothetical protein